MIRPALKQFLKKTRLSIIFKKIYQFLRRILFRLIRQQKIKKYVELHQVQKLQIGSGKNILKGWLNTDLNPTKELIYLDVTKRLPLNNNTFDFIFCEHVIEHIEYKKWIKSLNECFRILKPGGKIRIATSDIKFLIELYNPQKTELQEKYIKWAVNRYLPDIGIYRDTFVINNYFINIYHKFIYDFETLSDAMSKAGFVNIIRCNVGESGDKNLQNLEFHGQIISDEFNKLETMVIEGTKRA